MARRKARRTPKIEPVPVTLTFDLGQIEAASEGPGVVPRQQTHYIDLSQCVSLVSRKFLRQGLNWAVTGMKLNSVNVVTGTTSPVADSPAGSVMISKLPNTWVMSNAWHKGFAHWQQMNNEALQASESVKPKFLDFKVFMDAGHHAAGVTNNLLPVVGQQFNWDVAAVGEWDMSKYIIPDNTNPGFSTEREIVAVGENYPGAGASGFNAVSLIEGYAASRGLPDILDPNTPDDAADASGASPQNWLAALQNEGTSQDASVLEDMIDENNQAPYPFENDGSNVDTMYPGGANQLPGVEVATLENISGTTVGGVTYLSGSNFPCGLIRIDLFNNDSTFDMYNVLQVSLTNGPVRGYMAQPMQEM